MTRLTTGPKNPMIAYPATGALAWWDQELFQMIAQPAMTGKQQRIRRISRILGIREDRNPVRRMKMKQIPPSGNWKRMASRAEYPKVVTIKGPNPLTAPFTVYAEAIMIATSQTFISRNPSWIWERLNFVHRTPVCPYLKRSVAATRSSLVKNHAVTGEFGTAKQANPKRNVRDPANR